MKTNITSYYRKHDSFTKYVITNKPRVKQLSGLYAANRRYFGRRVLDLACGGGVLGFILERDKHRYTGIDINPDMISSARNYARRVNSRNRYITGDIMQRKIEGTFDTICILGNALCHFSAYDLSRILQNMDGSYPKTAYFIVDYRDMVLLMFNKRWNVKKRLVDNARGRISITEDCDTRAGFVRVLGTDFYGKSKVRFGHAIWSPFIISAIMNAFGWSLVRRRFSKRWSGWLDIYRRSSLPKLLAETAFWSS